MLATTLYCKLRLRTTSSEFVLCAPTLYSRVSICIIRFDFVLKAFKALMCAPALVKVISRTLPHEPETASPPVKRAPNRKFDGIRYSAATSQGAALNQMWGGLKFRHPPVILRPLCSSKQCEIHNAANGPLCVCCWMLFCASPCKVDSPPKHCDAEGYREQARN